MRLPNQKRPCKDCPFRKDCQRGWLRKARVKAILSERLFVCHKKKSLQCAGHMLMKKNDNDFYQVAARLGWLLLSGEELIFESEEECIKHHANE